MASPRCLPPSLWCASACLAHPGHFLKFSALLLPLKLKLKTVQTFFTTKKSQPAEQQQRTSTYIFTIAPHRIQFNPLAKLTRVAFEFAVCHAPAEPRKVGGGGGLVRLRVSEWIWIVWMPYIRSGFVNFVTGSHGLGANERAAPLCTKEMNICRNVCSVPKLSAKFAESLLTVLVKEQSILFCHKEKE